MKKRILSIILSIVMLVSLLPTTAFAAGTDTGKAIQLVDSGTAANIGGGQADRIYFGTYKQSSDRNSGYNVDPIKWRVLSNADGKLFLLSNQNLDVFEYHKEKESVTWETSTMRSWLNGYVASSNTGGDSGVDYTNDNFLDTAFSAEEQTAIADTTVVNDDNPDYQTEGGNNTTDKIFLLSIAEAKNTSYFANNNSRIATNTAYVAGGGEIGTNSMNSVGKDDYWWLRSPGKNDYNAAYVEFLGSVHSNGPPVNYAYCAVRPAFNLNLESVLFTSAADNSGHISRFGTALPDYSGSEWKLTLKDGNDFSTDAAINATKTYAGGKLEITHKALSSFVNAAYTDVTAMLQDAEGKILYYGSIDTNVTATKTILTIPTDIAVGDYVLSVYAEDWNGAYATDYATSIPFTTTISIRHIHPVCGATCTHDTDATTEGVQAAHTAVAWEPITSASELAAMVNGKSYYLGEDITVSSSISISGTVNLCLNGHTISAAGGYFDVAGTGTLNLCSCKDNGIIKRTTTTNALISADNGAAANLYNVTLDGGAVWSGTEDAVLGRGTTNSGITSSAPLIYAGGQRTVGGHITLNSGVILQNNECSDAGDGGAITLGEDGTLVINGATICNNAKTSGNAGAIKAYAGAQITMNSGEIYGNEAYKHGGAVQIFGGESTDEEVVVFTMNGGTIRNNKANGVGGGVAVSDYSSFTMNGGTIKDNATTDYSKRGGGVGFGDRNTAMSISGNAVISGNVAGINPNNLYIGNNDCNKLSVETMGSNANVGVTMSSPGVFSSGGASYAAQFNSDNAAYKVATDGSNLKLVALHTHNYTYSATGNIITESCTCGHEETATVSEPTGTIVYDGTEKKGATVSYSTGWLGGTLTVTYQNNINAGQATASITKNGATASVNFTIDKAASGNTLPTGLTATYGETLADVILPAGWTWNTPSQSVGDVGQKTFAAVYTPTNSNYKTVEADLMVTVGKATLTPENFLVLLSEDWSVALPASVTYNGNRRGVTVNRAPDGYTNSGTITVKYYDSNGTLLTSSPRDVGTYTIKLDITEGRCYKAATDLTSPDWTLTIGLASATLTPPTANDLTYNGGDQSLVSVGTAIGGELEYALGTDDTTAPVTGWSGALPQGQNAGTYYIWYKVVGDDNHNDVAPACVAVTIEKATPTVDDFVFTAPSDLVYNGMAKHATIVPKDGIVGMGEITYINYYVDGIQRNDASGVARYTVQIHTAEGDNYTRVDWLKNPDEWKFTISYLKTDAVATVSSEKGSNGWYVGEVALNAPEGYEISKKQYLSGFGSSHLTFNAEQNGTVTYYLKDVNGYIAEKTVDLKIDLTDPTAEYQIGTDGWKKFINTISFGLFCKDYKTVEIKYNDENSGVATKQYYIASAELSEDELMNVSWSDYTETLNLNATGKYFIYIRVVDNAGREVVLNSEGIVVYADSVAVTESISTTYHAEADKDVEVHFNGNTVKEIKNGNTVLDTADYTVDTANGEITLNGAYLDTLNAGTYTFTVSYNPQGVETDKVTLATTTFKVVVDKADGSVTNISDISKTYDGTSVSAPTFDKLGDGVATIEYKAKGADDSTYTTTAPKNAGDYVVRVTVAEGTNYKEAYGTAEFEIEKADAEIDDNPAAINGLIYNGNPQALVSAGSTDDGVIKYSLDGVVYSTNIPEVTNAGTYSVYVRIVGDENHNNSDLVPVVVKIDKATVTEPALANKPYTGSAQTADIVDTDLYTVEQNNGGVAQGSYDVVLKLKDAGNYKWATTDNAEVTVKFVISAAANAWNVAPFISGWTYGETAKASTYEAKFGTVKVTYTGKANDGSDYNGETAPTKAGNYTATFTVAVTEDYSGLSESVDFTIAKATYDMSSAKWNYTNAFKYDGKEHKVEVVGLPEGVTIGGYNGNTATVVGEYTAKVTLTYDTNNYNAPSVANLNWKVENNWTPTEYAVNGYGWMNSDFVIIANDGYKVSLTNTADGEWKDALTYSAETDNGSVTFYLKNETDGTISLAKTVTYKLDKTAPTGTVEFVDRTRWQEFVNTITFGLFYKDEVTVKITAADDLSGVAKVEYYASDEALTLEQVKAITDWTAYSDSFGVTFEDAKKFVYYVRITDNAGNVTYISTDGAEYDITAPVISDIENGATYYTTQKVNVTDKNLDTVTLNGNKVTDTVTLDGNKDVTYTIVATDKAGNTTTATVTMKPISDLSAPIDALNKDNVDGGDEEAVDEFKAAVAAVDITNATDEEKAALKEIADKAAELEKVIDNTKAEIARIDEELNKHNSATVNSDDAAALEQLAKDIKELLDGDNLTDTERTALTENTGKVAGMLKTVTDTTAENNRISDAVDGYDLATVTSDDKADLEQLLADIEKQLESTNLTEEEISELNSDKKAVEYLLTKIKGTGELIDKLINDVNEYSDDTVKSTDKDAIEQIIEDIDALLETENLTEDETNDLEDAKDNAEGLLETIDDADKATETENTEKVKDVTTENVAPEDKTDLEKAKNDLEKALEVHGDNYTNDKKKALEDEIKRIDDALEVIGNVEAVEDLIDKLPENITKNDEDAIKDADDAYNALSDYEKSLVDEDAKKALDDAKVALAELNKPADTDSPQTGDNSNMFLWIALLFISGGAVITLTVVDRKKRMASKR